MAISQAHNRKMLNKLKINTSSQIHQRPEVTGHSVAPKIGERQAGRYRESEKQESGNPRPAHKTAGGSEWNGFAS